jgi:HSP20 family protein
MAENQNVMTPKRDQSVAQRGSFTRGGPFGAMQRFADEMDRLFDNFGLGRQWGPLPAFGGARGWDPDVDVYQKDDQLFIKADLPGLKKDEVSVEVNDDAVTIQGERKSSHHEEREGYFRSERSYGSFCRVIPLPQGAITEQAKAEFRDGVLHVTMPVPPSSTKGRRLDIEAGTQK